MKKDNLKAIVCQKIDELKPILFQLADYLHAHPELSGQEIQAVEYLKQLLIKFGFNFKPIIEDKFSTAFLATKGTDKDKIKKLAFLTEYDALPDIGHGCGHNLISMMSLGAGISFNQVTDDICKTYIFGCPAEETIGAKLDISDRGFLDDVDCALIIHPDDKTTIGGTSYATHPLEFTFIGKEAHVADPDYHGINALDALVDFYAKFKELKHSFAQNSLVGMIITEGGTVPNIIPAKATMRATIRSTDTAYLEEIMLPQIKSLAKEIAKKYHAKVKLHHYEPLYKDLKNDLKLNDYYRANFAKLGEAYKILPEDYADGSTDVGNVSHVTRTCQPCIGISDKNKELFVHTVEFAIKSNSIYAKEKAIIGAKAMAMTAIDVLLED